MPEREGMQLPHQSKEAVPLRIAARSLRVPAHWLRQEIEAGRLPALSAGKVVLVHVPTVRRMLDHRARTSVRKERGT